MDYNEKLDIIQNEWEKASQEAGLKKFCRDGLMYKGEIFSLISDKDGKKYLCRKKGSENDLWHKSKKRILFLMKDTNDNDNQDYREWVGRQDGSIITHRFFKNIALWLYGLYTTDENGVYKPFEEAIMPTIYSKAFDDFPFAIINCKKESGEGKISNQALWEYCKQYGHFLKRQVEALEPNIIVCGGGSGIVRKIVQEFIYPHQFKKVNSWIYTNDSNSIVLIDSYHPSIFTTSYESIYNGMMQAYSEYVKGVNKTT